MSDWLKHQAQLIKAEEAAAAELKRRQQLSEPAVSQDWKAFWSSVLDLVAAASESFNEEFPGEPGRHIRIVSREPLILERHGNDSRIVVQASANSDGISMRRISTYSDGKQETSNMLDIEFGTDADGHVVAQHTGTGESAEDAAKAITQGLF